MAKNKKNIDLQEMEILFNLDRDLYKVIRFSPSKMMVDVLLFENRTKGVLKTLPFAHLPKEIKKIIKPNEK